ncbi:MAG: low affinity iron permease family protein [Pirellulales bacterium]
MNASWFSVFARRLSNLTGRPTVFAAATGILILWAVTGPLFGFSDTWQLVINTSTTIITFLMVFLIQNTQIRDTEAMQIKLDELIRSTQGAHNALLDLEELDDQQLEHFRAQYEKLARLAREKKLYGEQDVDSPEVDDGEFANAPPRPR